MIDFTMRTRAVAIVATIATAVCLLLATTAVASAPVPSPTPGSHTRLATTRPRTGCRAVAHIGDSTSVGLIEPDYLPDPADRMGAQYHDVGVRHVHLEIAGARSIVEVIPGSPNAYQVAESLIHSGYRGCWVLALGTNDTANVAVGSNVGRLARITKMMNLIGPTHRVMWVNVRSLLSSSPYSEANMELWDQALLKACATYPNMRIYNWADAVHDSWFSSDGIHFTSFGFQQRARLIANGLADAFPYESHSSGCLVS